MDLNIDTVDRLLSTTRVVRRRLDLDRAVSVDVLNRCLHGAAGPTAADQQNWHWVVITDPDRGAPLLVQHVVVNWPDLVEASSPSSGSLRMTPMESASTRPRTPGRRLSLPGGRLRHRAGSRWSRRAAGATRAPVRVGVPGGVEFPARTEVSGPRHRAAVRRRRGTARSAPRCARTRTSPRSFPLPTTSAPPSGGRSAADRRRRVMEPLGQPGVQPADGPRRSSP